ncbi:MAG: penicillin-binding protein 1C [Chthoniobacterales bacterium]
MTARCFALGCGGALLLLTAIWLALPKPPLLDGVSFSQCVRDRNGRLLRTTLTADQKFRIRTPLRAISPELIAATLRFEDRHYTHHPGVNPFALVRASASALHNHRIISGASTITMQVARLRLHLHTRTVRGKLEQMLRALELERHYSKDEILEAYLNLAPYGRNMEGAGAASELFFGKTAARLTQPEAVALSVIPQSPARRAPGSMNNTALNAAQNRWYDRAGAREDFSARSFSARAQMNGGNFAPHFVRQVLTEGRDEEQILTTLDLARQQMIERRIADYIALNRERGIVNAAVLLVDTRTMDVLAQVGSAEFWNTQINGQVDGTRAPRSPGSTLKPFVFALAIDQGIIHPLSILADAPRSFGDYNPENFDREFLGPIRATDALVRSRNVPAVALAAQLSHPSLYEFLRNAGVHLPRDEASYGLTLTLGGADISLERLVHLYAALANGGELRPLRRTSSREPSKSSRRILSAEAAFLTLDMLRTNPPPSLAEASLDSPVYWKTGTSNGFRDAWSIGVFDHYALGIWIGNFDGEPNPAFLGRAAAGPLLFGIIESLRASWPEPPVRHEPPAGANLKRAEFCSVSGNLPGPHCRQRTEGWFIPGVSPIKQCEMHREVLVESDSGSRGASDDGIRHLRREIYEFWPADLLELFESTGAPRRAPPFGADIPSTDAHELRMISPTSGPAVVIRRTLARDGIPLRAQADAGVRDIYWFSDRSFIGRAPPSQTLSWKAQSGEYELIALDDRGHSASCSVVVR